MNELAKKEAGNIMVVFYVIFDLIFTHSPHASRHMARQILYLIKNSFSLFFVYRSQDSGNLELVFNVEGSRRRKNACVIEK